MEERILMPLAGLEDTLTIKDLGAFLCIRSLPCIIFRVFAEK